MSQQTVKLLIVDDDEDDLYLIVEALREVTRTHYAITTAASPLKAMTELANAKFDVIFSDYRLGALTGVDFINSVRAAGIDTPIVLLTGITDHLIDNAALEAGSSDFIPKTQISPDVLDRTVRYALAHADRQRLMQTILKRTQTGIAVIESSGAVSLSNGQFNKLAKQAFGDAVNASAHLITAARASETKDLVVGDLVLESQVTELPDGRSLLAFHDVTQRVNDIRERERAEERIRALAMKDVLTGLPNRLSFNAHLDSSLTEAQLTGTTVTVLLFDFNRFKEVNDFYGHAAGDQILRVAADKLRSVLEPGEYCARLGGDEFVLVKAGCDVDASKALAQKVVGALAMELHWEDKVIEASVTVGVAVYPAHGKNREELLGNADLAMYRGKSDKDTSICVFDAGMDQFIRERRALAHDLRHAIHGSELTLDLQPQFNFATGNLTGCESLLRWTSPTRGQVSPAIFIPIAEENGLIIEIDRWVLERSCQLLVKHAWLPRLAVNLSAKAICQPQIVAQIRSALLNSGISPGRLELEITETALVHDLNRALHNLRQLKALGLSIALDDFGTGYSSLSLLSSFPFDRIKIDGSFIRLAGSNDRADEIFKAVVGLGVALRVPMLVEGVETEQQFAFANKSGCEEVQGFHMGRPVSEANLSRLLDTSEADRLPKDPKSWQRAAALDAGSQLQKLSIAS